MDDFEKKCKIVQNEQLGRYVIAAVDIKAGDTILLEQPLCILAVPDDKRCANCFKLTGNYCSGCLVFPLCGAPCVEHTEFECQFIQKNFKNLKIEKLQKSSQIPEIIKILLLNENPNTKNDFIRLIESTHHLTERRNTEIWLENHKNIIMPILESGFMQTLTLDDDEVVDIEDFLQKILAIIDVNCFEIRGPPLTIEAAIVHCPEELLQTTLRAIYLRGQLLSHNCVSNTVIAIDDKYMMKIYANCDIPKGDTIYNCYTNVLLDTDTRRHLLMKGKYFHCTCARCEDPTELGSHMSTLLCNICPKQNKAGYIIKKDNKWQCTTCDNILKNEWVENILKRTREEILEATNDIYYYELLLVKLSRLLHPNHYLMLDLKQNVAAILRAILLNLGKKPNRKVYERKTRLCQELLAVLRIIQPGISRLKAIALYEFASTFAELNRLKFTEQEISKSELVGQLLEMESLMRESIRLLLFEPVETPEGQLMKKILKELKALQNDMKVLLVK